MPPPYTRDAFASTLVDNEGSFDLATREGRKDSNRLLTRMFLDLQTRLRPGACIEIGAREAGFSRSVRTRLPGAELHAIEANPHTFALMRRTYDFTAAGVHYHHLAISDHDGPVAFNIQRSRAGETRSPVGGDNSLLLRNRTDVDYEPVTVDGLRFDSFVRQQRIEGRFSVWIDAEGAAGVVLSGFGEALNRVRSIMIEVEEKPFWQGQWLAPDVAAFLTARGFTPIARDYEYPSQHNVIYVRSRAVRSRPVVNSLRAYRSSLAALSAAKRGPAR